MYQRQAQVGPTIERLRALGDVGGFVIKPNRGWGGKGVLVMREVNGTHGVKISGAALALPELENELKRSLAGANSLDGQRDRLLVEALITSPQWLLKLSRCGPPDLRLVLTHGFPILAMLRLPTEKSEGCANLKKGGVAVGIDITTGETVGATHNNLSLIHI